MPMDLSKYPANWPEISIAVRERDGNRCKWCGVQNGAYGARDRFGVWHDEDDIHGLQSDVGYALFGHDWDWHMVKIILTVHHIGVDYPDGSPGNPRDKFDVRPENLVALCQRCHLNADRPHHIAKARETRARKRGQLTLDGVS